MPHVDEGEMHALLDGAYAHDAPAAARIREEIATCAECHARFDEAQAMRMRASAVLDRALPRPAAPPFESIVERAGTVEAPRPFRFPAGAPLAWAATIVLALGLGWFGRDWLNNPPSNAKMADQGSNVRTSTPAQSPVAPMETLAAPAPAASPSDARQRAEVELGRKEPLAKLAEGAAASTADQAGARRDQAELKAKPQETRAANDIQDAVAARDSLGTRAGEAVRERTAARAAAAPPPAAERAVTGAAFDRQTATHWEYVTEPEAERLTGRPVLIVQGLPVLNVGVSRIDGRYVTRVLQQLPDGATIEIVQEPVPDADRALAQRAEVRSAVAPQAAQVPSKDELGSTVLKLTRVGWVLTGRATLSQDSLRALLNSAR